MKERCWLDHAAHCTWRCIESPARPAAQSSAALVHSSEMVLRAQGGCLCVCSGRACVCSGRARSGAVCARDAGVCSWPGEAAGTCRTRASRAACPAPEPAAGPRQPQGAPARGASDLYGAEEKCASGLYGAEERCTSGMYGAEGRCASGLYRGGAGRGGFGGRAAPAA